MDNVPFAIGQKVVCLADGKWTPIRKGDVCTVTGFLYKNCCPASTGWSISLAEYNSNHLSKCPTCLTNSDELGQHFLARYFAPIQPMYENMSKQIAESITQTDEVPDRIFIPQTSDIKNQLVSSIDEMIDLLGKITPDNRAEYYERITSMIDKAKELVKE